MYWEHFCSLYAEVTTSETEIRLFKLLFVYPLPVAGCTELSEALALMCWPCRTTKRWLRKVPHSASSSARKHVSRARVPTQKSFSSLGKVSFLCQHRKGCPSLGSVPTTREGGKSCVQFYFLVHNHSYTCSIGAVIPHKAGEMGQNPLF